VPGELVTWLKNARSSLVPTPATADNSQSTERRPLAHVGFKTLGRSH